MALSAQESPPVPASKGRLLHGFFWFTGGVLAVVVVLILQAQLHPSFHLSPLSLLPEDLASTAEPEAKRPQHESPHHEPSPTSKQTPQPTDPSRRTWDSFDQIFYFGDSYTTLSFDPRSKQPSHKNPFGNGRVSRLRNWVQFLTLTHNASFVRSYDFAVGGSTVDRKLSTPFLLGTTLVEQIRSSFQPYYTGRKKRAKWNPDKTLFMFWFGVNDLYGPRARNAGPPPIADLMIRYQKAAETLYSDGARHMVFLTVPPFDRSVGDALKAKLDLIADISDWNSRIFEMRSNLRRLHSDLDAVVFDAYSLWCRVIAAPTDFEETETVKYPTRICKAATNQKPFPAGHPELAKCKTGFVKEYLWYGLHGTYTIHNATARRITTDCFGLRGRSGYCS